MMNTLKILSLLITANLCFGLLQPEGNESEVSVFRDRRATDRSGQESPRGGGGNSSGRSPNRNNQNGDSSQNRNGGGRKKKNGANRRTTPDMSSSTTPYDEDE